MIRMLTTRTAHGVCLLLFLAAIAGPATGAEAQAPPAVDKPLAAYWTFDALAPLPCDDASGNGWTAEAGPGPALERTGGVYGGAMRFSGQHHLQVKALPPLGTLPAISFSAWVRPEELSSYREIFRKEDGEQRILFSFQNDGRILSLGLNIGGYIECDAPVDPRSVVDGEWHHAAATFDGRVMRVYLDGAQIGQLERPGEILAGGAARGSIGSSSGGECFQGTIDDLRIYRAALSSAEIATLFIHGRTLVDAGAKALAEHLDKIYTRREGFAATLAGCRRYLAEHQLRLDRKFSGLVMSRLRTDFPEDFELFSQCAGSDLGGCLAEQDYLVRLADRTVELLLEYKPLTETQRKRQSPEDLRKWEAADAIRAKLEQVKAQPAGADPSAALVEVILAAGRGVQFRPKVQEAVAPYVRPETPPLRQFTADEARAMTERDWLHQAGGAPTPERIRQEIEWTRRLAARIERTAPGKVDFAADMAALAKLEERAAALTGPDQELYFQVRRIKRAIMLRNPAVDFSKVLMVDMPFPSGSEWRHETRHRLGYMAVPGGRLLVLEGLAPDAPVRQLMPQPPLHGSFWRPDVSYDATKVLFCFKPHNEKSFHVYEIGVDGSNLVQLTDGIFDDMDPIYLPDGHLLFSTTRGHTYVRCMPPTNAFVLARCDADGRNVYFVSANNEPDYLPSVMNDGRVIYTRWEYTDKPLWRAQKLWTINPDGTRVNTFWGNQSVWPDVVKDARAIPGSRRVMFAGCGHHDWFAGCVGIIDPDRGLNFPGGLTKVTADLPWPESGNGPVDPVECADYHPSGQFAAYYSPYPLGEQDFLVSAERGGNADKFLLYLMDVEGNRELIYEGANHIFHAIPVRPRRLPPVLPDRVAWPKQGEPPADGVLYSANVYQNAPPELLSKARFLRVLSIDHKTYTYWHKRPYLSTGPVVSIVQSDGVKRLLGAVPVDPDGSVSFHVPSGIPLHFQLLDENGLALQTMRSFVNVMPGEQRGCLGCHESHSRAPLGDPGQMLYRTPHAIAPPPWGVDTISYPRYVRPVLTKYCAKCHEGDGEAVKALDLTPRPGFLGFDEPYAILTGRPSWGAPYVMPEKPVPGFGFADMLMVEGYHQRDPDAYRTPAPMTRLSYRSRLIQLCSGGKHYNVKVDPESLQRLIVWVDAMCPYRGEEEVRSEDDPIFQGVDWLAIRPRIKTAPRIVRPGPVD